MICLPTAAGVALEREGVADEDPPDFALRQLVAVVVEDLDFHTLDDRTDRRRIALQVLGPGDGGERDLGRAVHVVDDGTEVFERAVGQLGAQLRAGYEHDPQAGQVGLLVHLLDRVEDPRQHHRHHHHGCRLVLLDVFQHQRRLELAPQHQRRAQEHRQCGVQVTQRMEHRRRQRGHLAGLERNVRQDAADRRQRRRGTAVRPLRGAGGPAGQDDDRRVLARLRGGCFAAARDQLGQRFVGAARRLVCVRVDAERAQLAQRGLGFADSLGVFVVVDDHLGAFALRHFFDLRAGELAVEQDDAGADPGGAVVGDDETSGGFAPGGQRRRRRGHPWQ